MWKNLVLPIIRGNKLEGYITGAKPYPPEFTKKSVEGTSQIETIVNTDFEDWVAQDQILLGWLYNSIETNVAAELIGYTTSKQLWEEIRDIYAVKTRSDVIYYKREFVNPK